MLTIRTAGAPGRRFRMNGRKTTTKRASRRPNGEGADARISCMSVRDLLIIGAGPAGLAVAIAASEAHLDYEVVEKGVLVNSIFNFPPGMTFFTTPDLLEIGKLPFVTPYEKPTRHEALRYYRRVVDAYRMNIVFGEEVLAIEKEIVEGETVFLVECRSDRGVRRGRRARAVVFAIGYYDQPNILGIPGEDLPHVRHYYGDPHAHYRQNVLVVGGKNSAAIASLELYRAGAQVTLVHRGATLSDRIKYLDSSRHRQPHQGRIGHCLFRVASARDPSNLSADRGADAGTTDGCGRRRAAAHRVSP